MARNFERRVSNKINRRERAHQTNYFPILRYACNTVKGGVTTTHNDCLIVCVASNFTLIRKKGIVFFAKYKAYPPGSLFIYCGYPPFEAHLEKNGFLFPARLGLGQIYKKKKK